MKPQVTISQDGANKPIAYVLDDEGPVGTLVARMLLSLGYATLTFTEVPQCLQQLKEAPEYSKPALIVLDLALGKHDAVDVFDQLKNLGFKGRLLLMSGVDETTLSDVQKICTSRGLTAFAPLKKPFRIDDLKERLSSKTVLPEADEAAIKGPAVSLERALAGATLALWYQKTVDLGSGTPCGAEAQLYAQHPAYGYVPMVDSLPPPESALYFPLARTVIRQIKADWNRCFANERLPLRFSTKLPLPAIVSRGFVALLRETLSTDANFPGLTIEVTDAHQLKNTPGLWEVAAQLRLHRVTLSITDIGAAYAAVTRNQKFPFAEIKLDADLVNSCVLHKVKRSACQGLIDLAHGAGAVTCAEGVASRDQLQALVAMGCDRAQGPLCGKPQPIDAFKASLRSAAVAGAEKRLVQSQKLEAVGQLTGGIAHDFNNLLLVIIGNLDLLKETTPADSPALDLIESSLTAALNGSELSNGLLTFSRQQAIKVERIDFKAIVADQTRLLKRAMGRGVTLKMELADDVHPIDADAAQLRCALTNLAVNARDAMPNGGTVTVRSYNKALTDADRSVEDDPPPGDYAILEVSDTGVGIPPDSLQRIFDPFYTTKEVGKGTGLGLSMVYGFVKQLNGKINVVSEVGKGTTFSLFFARAKALHDSAAPKRAQTEDPAPAGKPERILVVDDDAMVRKSVIAQLTSLGYGIIEVETPNEALDVIARKEPFDLLLSDIVMPGGIDGVELARLARERDHKVLLTSGFPDLKTARSGEELFNQHRVLKKPYRRADLQQAVRAVLDG